MFCTEARGTAAWIEWASVVSEALGASIRATCLTGPPIMELKREIDRLSSMWYRIVYGTPTDDDQVELIVALGMVSGKSIAYYRAVALRDLMFRAFVQI